MSFVVDREVVIRARRSTVFRYFTDSERFAAWWGQGSSIDGRPGGAVRIRYPNGEVAGGEVVEIVDGERVIFTYGYEDPKKPIALGGSRVTVTFEDHSDGTRVRLVHEVADAKTRDLHVAGWRFQLSLFAVAVANELHRNLESLVDGYFAAWNDGAALDGVTDDIEICDQWACLRGRDDLTAHLAASRMFMPGVRLERVGPVAHCQGTAVVDWQMKQGDAIRGKGINVMTLSPEGKIARVVGLAR
jgi:uncharacterized protein YndB with AHSA1/START domain